MSVANFIPVIWSAMILENLRKNLVYGGLCNRNYQGNVTAGNAVKINSIGPVAVRNYERTNTTDALTDATQNLLIDQQKYFQFEVDDVDAAQANAPLVQAAMSEAGYAMADAIDQFIAGKHTEAGITSNLGTDSTAIEINAGNVLDYLRLVSQMMTENSVPTGGRWMVIPPWFETKIKKAAQNIITMNEQIVRTGYIGSIEGFDLFVSNNVKGVSATTFNKILAGNNSSITLAQQIEKTETLRVEGSFGDVIRGLSVYGAKVVRANTLACLTASFKADS